MAARARSSLVSPRSESLLLRLLSALLSVVLLRVLVIPAPLVLALSRRTPCLRELPDGYFNRSEPNFAHMCHTLLYSCAFLQPVNGTVSMWACRCAGAVGWPRRQRCQRSRFCSGDDGAVLRSLSPSASCEFGFPGVLAGRFAPYSSADGSVSPRSDGFKWADLSKSSGGCPADLLVHFGSLIVQGTGQRIHLNVLHALDSGKLRFEGMHQLTSRAYDEDV